MTCPKSNSSGGGTSTIRALHELGLVTVCIILAAVALNMAFWLLHKGPPQLPPPQSPSPPPPNLSGCTQIEIRYEPRSFGYPVWSNEAEKTLLTLEEMQHIGSLIQCVVDDPEQIRVFARNVASGEYIGTGPGGFNTSTSAIVTCQFDNRPPMHLVVVEDQVLITEEKQQFNYETPLGTLTQIGSQVQSSKLLPQVRLRIDCARNLAYLYAGLRGFEDHVAYPSASTWCDTVVERYLPQGDSQRYIRKHFECPAVWGSWNYAMNPNCEPDSPADTVLLFEVKGGWNQQGGPEMFTLDNHDPKGGLVLLNDGTVKFIRTEEELKQLRWR